MRYTQDLHCNALELKALRWNAQLEGICVLHWTALRGNALIRNVLAQNTSKQGLAACRTDRRDLLKCNVLLKQLHQYRMHISMHCASFRCTEMKCTEKKCGGFRTKQFKACRTDRTEIQCLAQAITQVQESTECTMYILPHRSEMHCTEMHNTKHFKAGRTGQTSWNAMCCSSTDSAQESYQPKNPQKPGGTQTLESVPRPKST